MLSIDDPAVVDAVLLMAAQASQRGGGRGRLEVFQPDRWPAAAEVAPGRGARARGSGGAKSPTRSYRRRAIPVRLSEYWQCGGGLAAVEGAARQLCIHARTVRAPGGGRRAICLSFQLAAEPELLARLLRILSLGEAFDAPLAAGGAADGVRLPAWQRRMLHTTLGSFLAALFEARMLAAFAADGEAPRCPTTEHRLQLLRLYGDSADPLSVAAAHFAKGLRTCASLESALLAPILRSEARDAGGGAPGSALSAAFSAGVAGMRKLLPLHIAAGAAALPDGGLRLRDASLSAQGLECVRGFLPSLTDAKLRAAVACCDATGGIPLAFTCRVRGSAAASAFHSAQEQLSAKLQENLLRDVESSPPAARSPGPRTGRKKRRKKAARRAAQRGAAKPRAPEPPHPPRPGAAAALPPLATPGDGAFVLAASQHRRSRVVTLIVGPIIEDLVDEVLAARGGDSVASTALSAASSPASFASSSASSSPDASRQRRPRARRRTRSTEHLLDMAPLGLLPSDLQNSPTAAVAAAGAARASGTALNAVAPWALGDAMWSTTLQARDLDWSQYLPEALVPTSPPTDWRAVGAPPTSLHARAYFSRPPSLLAADPSPPPAPPLDPYAHDAGAAAAPQGGAKGQRQPAAGRADPELPERRRGREGRQRPAGRPGPKGANGAPGTTAPDEAVRLYLMQQRAQNASAAGGGQDGPGSPGPGSARPLAAPEESAAGRGAGCAAGRGAHPAAELLEDRSLLLDMCLRLEAETAMLRNVVAMQRGQLAAPFLEVAAHAASPLRQQGIPEHAPATYEAPWHFATALQGRRGSAHAVQPRAFSDCGKAVDGSDTQSFVSDDDAVQPRHAPEEQAPPPAQLPQSPTRSLGANLAPKRAGGAAPAEDGGLNGSSSSARLLRTRLGDDVALFVRYVSAQQEATRGACTACIEACRAVVRAIWPRAQVTPYGSFVTGLRLPSSDVDLVVSLPKVRKMHLANTPGALESGNAIKEREQQLLARALAGEREWVERDSVKVIAQGPVPLVKLRARAVPRLAASSAAHAASDHQAARSPPPPPQPSPSPPPWAQPQQEKPPNRAACKRAERTALQLNLDYVTSRYDTRKPHLKPKPVRAMSQDMGARGAPADKAPPQAKPRAPRRAKRAAPAAPAAPATPAQAKPRALKTVKSMSARRRTMEDDALADAAEGGPELDGQLVRLDVSFESPSHCGVAANGVVRELVDAFPALRPLVLVLKQLGKERNLSASYTGGLSNYALTLMVARYLQEMAGSSGGDIGSLLLGFLEFYGTCFDPRRTGISVTRSHYFCRRSGQAHSYDPLVIEDPLSEENNVGRNCFRINQVLRAWQTAAKALQAKVDEGDGGDGAPGPTAGRAGGRFKVMSCMIFDLVPGQEGQGAAAGAAGGEAS